MPRKKQIFCPTDPYHITARSNNREKFEAPLNEAWPIMCDYLCFIKYAFECKIHSFVLMKNHFHLIATFPNDNYSEAMNYFMRETSREMGRSTNRINHAYGSRARPSHLNSFLYFTHAYKYVYRNPVKAKICENVEDYPYSTLHGLVGRSRLDIPLAKDTLLFDQELESALIWLNTPTSAENDDAIGKALKKTKFQLRKNPDASPHYLETGLS